MECAASEFYGVVSAISLRIFAGCAVVRVDAGAKQNDIAS